MAQRTGVTSTAIELICHHGFESAVKITSSLTAGVGGWAGDEHFNWKFPPTPVVSCRLDKMKRSQGLLRESGLETNCFSIAL